MQTKTKLTLALAAALGLATSGVFAATDAQSTTWTSWQAHGNGSVGNQIAAKGRGGHDDVIEHPKCDDHGDDLACILA